MNILDMGACWLDWLSQGYEPSQSYRSQPLLIPFGDSNYQENIPILQWEKLKTICNSKMRYFLLFSFCLGHYRNTKLVSFIMAWSKEWYKTWYQLSTDWEFETSKIFHLYQSSYVKKKENCCNFELLSGECFWIHALSILEIFNIQALMARLEHGLLLLSFIVFS